jgi:hypothetical protein
MRTCTLLFFFLAVDEVTPVPSSIQLVRKGYEKSLQSQQADSFLRLDDEAALKSS